MKKIIILSFIVLFFAGISNNANAQKTDAQTVLTITYVWHCTPNPNADLDVTFYGWTEKHGYLKPHFHFDNLQQYVHSRDGFTDVSVDVTVNGNFAYGHKTIHVVKDPNSDYITDIYITIDIYNAPPMMPAW